MCIKMKIMFAILIIGFVSPQLMAATVSVPTFNSFERSRQLSTIGNSEMVTFAAPILSQFKARPQNDFLTRSAILIVIDKPMQNVHATSAVPIPATLWLLLPAMVGYLSIRQRCLTAEKRIKIGH